MCKRHAAADLAAALLSNMDKQTLKTWTAEKVSEWIVDNCLPEYVTRTFKGIASHHFQFVLVCKLACTVPSSDFCTKWRKERQVCNIMTWLATYKIYPECLPFSLLVPPALLVNQANFRFVYNYVTDFIPTMIILPFYTVAIKIHRCRNQVVRGCRCEVILFYPCLFLFLSVSSPPPPL